MCFLQANLVLWVKYCLNLEGYLSFFLLAVQVFFFFSSSFLSFFPFLNYCFN